MASSLEIHALIETSAYVLGAIVMRCLHAAPRHCHKPLVETFSQLGFTNDSSLFNRILQRAVHTSNLAKCSLALFEKHTAIFKERL